MLQSFLQTDTVVWKWPCNLKEKVDPKIKTESQLLLTSIFLCECLRLRINGKIKWNKINCFVSLNTQMATSYQHCGSLNLQQFILLAPLTAAQIAVNTTLTYYHLTKVVPQLIVYTSRGHRAKESLTWSHVWVNITDFSPTFTLYLLSFGLLQLLREISGSLATKCSTSSSRIVSVCSLTLSR